MPNLNQCEIYPFSNPPLPAHADEFEPLIDKRTMLLHHDAHARQYVDKLNSLLEAEPSLQRKTLCELIRPSARSALSCCAAIRRTAGGVYSHRLYFELLAPAGERNVLPVGELGAAIIRKYGNFSGFFSCMKNAAMSVFGSGNVFLLQSSGTLEITACPDQQTPLTQTCTPLLVLDVWEHAYYLLHQNRRGDYVDNWFRAVNWRRADERYRARSM